MVGRKDEDGLPMTVKKDGRTSPESWPTLSLDDDDAHRGLPNWNFETK